MLVSINAPDFRRIFVTENDVELKIEFVSDFGFHYNGFDSHPLYYKVDNPMNILSNKLCALQRQAPKDIADLIWFCLKYEFDWMFAFENAANKDTWVNEADAVLILRTFDQQKLCSEVKWITQPDNDWLKNKIEAMCYDIAPGGSNSLYGKV